MCLDMMKVVNIKRIYYINKDGILINEFVKDMISIHSSSVTRFIHKIKSKLPDETLIEYFHNLLIKYFPKKIKKKNFMIFASHDLASNLPEYSYYIKENVIYILNEKKKFIISSNLIDDSI
jgi:uncharacterized protein YbcV (DUF1398 family)